MHAVESAPSSGIPDELKRYRQWMGTRFAPRAGSPSKIDKPPYRVRKGQPVRKADKTTPANWATYDEAVAAYERGQVHAIGFVFTEEDPFFVVDLDGVVDGETGEIGAAAAEIIHSFASYSELSCSGTGVHIIATGHKPDFAGCRTKELGFDVEIYDRERFLVVTGNTLRSTAPQERQGELDGLCRRLWPRRPRPPRRPPNTGPVDLEDAVLLERARTARSGPKFHKLYDLGDPSGYASHSEADFSLLNMLCFWCAGDRERIIELFEASALYRKEGKGRNYAALSTDNALASYTGKFYRPRLTKEVREEAEQDPLDPYLALLLDPSAWSGRRAASAYKATAAIVVQGAEDGIIDDEGDLSFSCDLRRLAEIAGVSYPTLSRSALPYLMKDMGLLKWKRTKGGRQAGVLTLKNPARRSANNKMNTHFIVSTSAPPKNALETLRLLIRMRYGYAKSDTLLRLGMPAMFVAIALASDPDGFTRGKSATELAEMTGRRVRDLEAHDGPLRRLKAAGVVQELQGGCYRLRSDFAANYERALELSGITYAERAQKRRHAKDRAARDAKLQPSKRVTRLRGKEQMTRLLKKRQAEERKKARRSQNPPPEPVEEEIAQAVREGMAPAWARRAVLGRGHPMRCPCEVCSWQ